MKIVWITTLSIKVSLAQFLNINVLSFQPRLAFHKKNALISLQILSEDQCQDFLVARVNSQTFKISEKYLKGKFPPFPVGQKK